MLREQIKTLPSETFERKKRKKKKKGISFLLWAILRELVISDLAFASDAGFQYISHLHSH